MATAFKKERQRGALERLRTQLESGVKTEKGGTAKVPLTEKNIKRIEKEIATLESRV